MDESILELVRARSAVSYAELCREVPGFAGDGEIHINGMNVVLWTGVSTEDQAALQRLCETDRLVMRPCSAMTYMVDGQHLRLPIADKPRHLTRPNKRTRWLPVVFDLPSPQRTIRRAA